MQLPSTNFHANSINLTTIPCCEQFPESIARETLEIGDVTCLFRAKANIEKIKRKRVPKENINPLSDGFIKGCLPDFHLGPLSSAGYYMGTIHLYLCANLSAQCIHVKNTHPIITLEAISVMCVETFHKRADLFLPLRTKGRTRKNLHSCDAKKLHT